MSVLFSLINCAATGISLSFSKKIWFWILLNCAFNSYFINFFKETKDGESDQKAREHAEILEMRRIQPWRRGRHTDGRTRRLARKSPQTDRSLLCNRADSTAQKDRRTRRWVTRAVWHIGYPWAQIEAESLFYHTYLQPTSSGTKA